MPRSTTPARCSSRRPTCRRGVAPTGRSSRSVHPGSGTARSRRQRAAAPGDRGRDAAGAAARVGARPGDVPNQAGSLPDLPVNGVLVGLLAVAAADTLWLQNDRLRLAFDANTGALLAFTDRA